MKDKCKHGIESLCSYCWAEADQVKEALFNFCQQRLAKAELLLKRLIDPNIHGGLLNNKNMYYNLQFDVERFFSPEMESDMEDKPKSFLNSATPSDLDRKYPCIKCGTLRTEAEGGTTFTVCDECWDKEYPCSPNPSDKVLVRREDVLIAVQTYPESGLTEVDKWYRRHCDALDRLRAALKGEML